LHQGSDPASPVTVIWKPEVGSMGRNPAHVTPAATTIRDRLVSS